MAELTRLHIFLYTVVLLAGTLMPFIYGMSGWIYLVSAITLGLCFMVYGFRLWRQYSEALARRTFWFSILYLSLLFAALLLDHYISPWLGLPDPTMTLSRRHALLASLSAHPGRL
jgi:protoheme IX farnesyltransferase